MEKSRCKADEGIGSAVITHYKAEKRKIGAIRL